MNQWEEYKYVFTADYCTDKWINGVFWGDDGECVICHEHADKHIKEELGNEERPRIRCVGKILRTYWNRYTRYRVGVPLILDLYEVNEGRYTQ